MKFTKTVFQVRAHFHPGVWDLYPGVPGALLRVRILYNENNLTIN